jgi:hypothetical protein
VKFDILIVVAVKNAAEGIRDTGPNDVEIRPRVDAQIDIGHELEMLVPVLPIGPDGVHLFGGVDQVGVVGLARAAAIFCVGRQTQQTDTKQYKQRHR